MKVELNKEEMISAIIKMELEITSAIISGHKASENDQFRNHRELLKEYRRLVFGEELRKKSQ